MVYQTKQRKVLLEFLASHADEALSAQQIALALHELTISESAVYRNLSALENQGKVRRVNRTGSRETLYQYTEASCCQGHLHLSCKKCGRTYHMDRQDADRLAQALAMTDDFELDKKETVLYGICHGCKTGGVI